MDSESGYVKTLDIADPAAPEMAWPNAGSAGPPRIDSLGSCSTSWSQYSRSSYTLCLASAVVQRVLLYRD